MNTYKQSLFIFRRDLRLEDNTGLINALKKSKSVIPCFIFDPRQVGNKNKYKSTNAIQFMIESLQNLDLQIQQKKGTLFLFYGPAEDIVKNIIKENDIDAIFINQDYTPFSIKRDTAIKKMCSLYDIAFESYADILLNEPQTITKKNGNFYSVFSAFYKKAQTIFVTLPKKMPLSSSFFTGHIKNTESTNIYKHILAINNKNLHSHGGSKNALTALRKIKNLKNYKKDHDYPIIPTSLLSAHLKFGTVSVRRVYYAIKNSLGSHHPLLRQLYWRDFFTHVACHNPYVFGKPFHKKYESLSWSTNKTFFNAWKNGMTGFPIVDAGMRQLNTTGFMHNRIRMIVGSFLTKDLHISWLWGEKYFAQKLIDYDPVVNNGNWQWIASTGCDAQPYFRIFNPWLQQKKYDPECLYIKTWIPELKNVDNKTIHNWFKENSPIIRGYPRPCINHAKESSLAKKMYKL